MSQALGDGELGLQMQRLDRQPALAAPRTELGRPRPGSRFTTAGVRRGGLGAGGDRRSRRPDGRARTRTIRARRSTTSTSSRSNATSAGRPPTTSPGCASWSGNSGEQGWITRTPAGLTLSPKALRRIGNTALRRVLDTVHGRRRGQHDMRDAGAAGEVTGASRRWEFGDEQPLDVVRTVTRAVARGSGVPIAARASTTSRWSTPNGAPRRRWRSASTCRSPWCGRAAGVR